MNTTIPENFDPLWIALGIKRKSWTAPVQQQKVSR
jgi:hypothetical protein